MDFTAYITLCLILVAPSCHSTREERAAKRAWTPVDAQPVKYLALLNTGTANKMCSGSIPSESTVLTYCAGTPTIAYAGLLKFTANAPDNTSGSVQERTVTRVEPNTGMENLKICFVNNWNLNGHVGTAPLRSDENDQSAAGCKVAAFRTSGADAIAHTIEQTIGDDKQCPEAKNTDSNHLYSKTAKVQGDELTTLEVGGPAVNQDKLWGIIVKYDELTPSGGEAYYCYSYVNIAKFSKWIEEQKNAAESGAPGGTGGNSTSPSSGYSIHSYLNKYSNWKVLGFLVPIILTFLQY